MCVPVCVLWGMGAAVTFSFGKKNQKPDWKQPGCPLVELVKYVAAGPLPGGPSGH